MTDRETLFSRVLTAKSNTIDPGSCPRTIPLNHAGFSAKSTVGVEDAEEADRG